jgi:hypothetical protein
MTANRWLLTVHWNHIPKTTYLFDTLRSALHSCDFVKGMHPDVKITLIRKELTHEQCEAVLSTGQLPT